MKLCCPICESKFTLEQAAREQSMRDLVELAAFFGHNWDLVIEYVDCFRAGQWGSVGFAKRLRLLRDVRKLFETGVYEYAGKKYRADRAKVTAAIRVVVDTEKHGFKNHNYLKKVLLGEAERVSAEGLTSKEEQAREETRRAPKKRVDPEEQNEMVPLGEYLRREGIKSLADKIGHQA